MLKIYRLQGVIFVLAVVAFFLVSIFYWQQPVQALTYPVTAVPENLVFTGLNVGNQSQFSSNLDLNSFPASALLNSASIHFVNSTSSNATILVYDKYSLSINPLTLPVVAGSLINSGNQSFDLTALVTAWRQDPSHNLGLLFKMSGLEANEGIELSGIGLQIEYSTQDLTPPVINGITAQRLPDGKYHFSASSNEPVKSGLDYGKTSSYTIHSDNSEFTTQIVFDIDNLQPGITYHYRLRAEDAAGNKSSSPDAVFATSGTVAGTTNPATGDGSLKLDPNLQPPANIGLELTGNGKVPHLTWTASTNGGTLGYVIYRNDSGSGNFNEIARVMSSQISYDDIVATPGQSVQYQVRAFTASGVSVAITSNELEIPLAVSGQVAGISDARVQIVLGLFAGALIIAVVGLFLWKSTRRFINWFKLPEAKKGLQNSLHDPEAID